MRAWNFKVKSNPQEIIKKLDSAFGSVDSFVYNVDHNKNDSAAFKVRKRSLNYLNFIRENQIIVNGKILETDTENETNIEISFTQHFLRILYGSIYLVFGLLSIILGIINSATIFIIAGFLLLVGIAIWIDVQKQFARNIQEYKTLFSEILEL
jgi:hypothetical protein